MRTTELSPTYDTEDVFMFYNGSGRFKMDTTIRNERFARDSSGTGWSGGDIYCGTIIQVLKDFLIMLIYLERMIFSRILVQRLW